MNILQIRQSQIPGLPFKAVGILQIEGRVINKEVEDRYTIIKVPQPILGIPYWEAYTILNEMAAAAGFTHLMLMYNE